MLVNHIFRLIFILLGAWMISGAINAYRHGWYFVCGINTMMAVYDVIYLFKVIFEF